MASLRRLGEATGAGLDTLGSDLEENQKLKMEYGYRNQLRQDQLNQHQQDFLQRQSDIEGQNAQRTSQFNALHPELQPAAGGTYTPSTSVQNPTPYSTAIEGAKAPEDVVSQLQKFIGSSGMPVGPQLTSNPVFQQLSGQANTKYGLLNDQNARVAAEQAAKVKSDELAHQQAATDPTIAAQTTANDVAKQTALMPGEEKKAADQATLEEQLREQGEAKKENNRRLTAAAKVSDPQVQSQAAAATRQLLDAWDKANSQTNATGVGGVPIMDATTHPYLHNLGMLTAGHMPGFEKSSANPNVQAYQQATETASMPIGRSLATGSRGVTAAQMVQKSLPKIGDDYQQGRQRILALAHQQAYGTQTAQLPEDTDPSEYANYIKKWDDIKSVVQADIAKYGPKSKYAGAKTVKDPETGIEIPIR